MVACIRKNIQVLTFVGGNMFEDIVRIYGFGAREMVARDDGAENQRWCSTDLLTLDQRSEHRAM